MRVRLLIALMVAPVFPALASDGVLEINQTCAAGPGCFPGDEPGFPVRIINSGSYVLTGNLVVPALVEGITTRLANTQFPNDIRLSLDLNGFSISSTTTCSGTPLICSPTSQTEGVGVWLRAEDGGAFQLQNGTIQGMALAGAACFPSCIARDLLVSNNGVTGISGNGSFRNIAAFKNGQSGINLLSYGTVEGSTSSENGDIGFSGPGTFIQNAADLNGGSGFEAGGSVLIGNYVNGGAVGINCGACTVQNNRIFNSTTGINFGNSAALYGGNVISGATTNIANGDDAVQTAPNICDGAACP